MMFSKSRNSSSYEQFLDLLAANFKFKTIFLIIAAFLKNCIRSFSVIDFLINDYNYRDYFLSNQLLSCRMKELSIIKSEI